MHQESIKNNIKDSLLQREREREKGEKEVLCTQHFPQEELVDEKEPHQRDEIDSRGLEINNLS